MSVIEQVNVGGTLYDIVDGATVRIVCDNIQSTLVATKTYNAGEYFYYNGDLYKVTQTVASGGTFVVGVNCTQTTAGEELTQINTALARDEVTISVITAYASGNIVAYRNINTVTIEFNLLPAQTLPHGNAHPVGTIAENLGTHKGTLVDWDGNPYELRVNGTQLQVYPTKADLTTGYYLTGSFTFTE